MIADPVAPQFDSLLVHVESGIGQLRLNRPAKLNALSPALMREIIAASGWLATLPDLRVVVVGGEGRAFCAGVDLGGMRASRDTLDRQATDLGRQMIEALEAIPAVRLAVVQGHCVGGGVLIAAACDLRVAGDDVRFAIPEMDLGIPLTWGGVPRLVRLLGPAVALELVLDCRPFDAAQALDWRFVNRVLPAAQLRSHALEWAHRLARHPLQALRETKRRFAAAADKLCTGAGSEADADVLLAAYRDPETLAAQQRYLRARKG